MERLRNFPLGDLRTPPHTLLPPVTMNKTQHPYGIDRGRAGKGDEIHNHTDLGAFKNISYHKPGTH